MCYAIDSFSEIPDLKRDEDCFHDYQLNLSNEFADMKLEAECQAIVASEGNYPVELPLRRVPLWTCV